MKVHVMSLGPIETNCYIVEGEDTLLVIDPGAEAQRVHHRINSLGKKVEAVLLTHSHFDHIGAVDEVCETYGTDVYIGEEEKYWLSDPVSNGSEKFKVYHLPEVIVTQQPKVLKAGPVELGEFKFKAVKTPGHSPGSLSFIFERFAIVGDTLFKEGIGRTDLKEGNLQQLMNSIHNELLTLSDDMIIYPGHGPKTTVAEEIENNPYLNGFA